MTGAAASPDRATALLLASLQGAGDALAIDCTAVVAAAPVFGAGLQRWARATVDGRTDRLALTGPWPGDAAVEAALTRAGAKVQRTALSAYAERPAAARFLELESLPGDARVATAVQMVGAESLSADLARLSAATPFRATSVVASAAGLLGRSHDDGLIHRAAPETADQWTVRFTFAAEQLASSSRGALALMERLGVESLQRLVFERLHPLLAPAGCLLGLTTYFDQLGDSLRITYHAQEWPLVCRTVAEMTGRGECAPALGAFAGAFQAERASSLELCLRAKAAATARISVDI